MLETMDLGLNAQMFSEKDLLANFPRNFMRYSKKEKGLRAKNAIQAQKKKVMTLARF